MPRKYFVFECYQGSALLFRSFGKDGRMTDPLPLSDPELQIRQARAKAAKLKLSYQFIASGLSRESAEQQLRDLDRDALPPQPIVWHPDSGTKPLKSASRPILRRLITHATTIDSAPR
jgi:hypothetical protein